MPLLHGCWRVLFPWTTADAKAAWYIAHGACWMSLFAFAWFLNAAFTARLVLPWPWLHALWLPLLLVFVYGAGGMFAGLQRHAASVQTRSRFADIDEAWQHARTALVQARLDPAYLPIFLVLGKPTHGVKALWEASSLHVAVSALGETPFCVTASRGAIFVWCGSVTRLGTAANPQTMLSNDQIGQRFEALLNHLAALRRPYCPINGILALMPYAAAETDASAESAREQCQLDVQQARNVLGVECPVTLLVADLEQDPGFRDLLDRLSEEDRWQALGQRFPMMPDVDPHEAAPLLAQGVTWFCRQRLPGLVYDHLRSEDDSTAANARMTLWLAEMQNRAERFGRWCAALAPRDEAAPPLIAGCFFAATGATAAVQGCVGGVFKTLVEHQDHVAWAPQQLQHAAVYRRWTRWALGSVGVAALAMIVCGWVI